MQSEKPDPLSGFSASPPSPTKTLSQRLSNRHSFPTSSPLSPKHSCIISSQSGALLKIPSRPTPPTSTSSSHSFITVRFPISTRSKYRSSIASSNTQEKNTSATVAMQEGSQLSSTSFPSSFRLAEPAITPLPSSTYRAAARSCPRPSRLPKSTDF